MEIIHSVYYRTVQRGFLHRRDIDDVCHSWNYPADILPDERPYCLIFATLLILQPIDWVKLIYAVCNPDYVAGESLARYYFGIAFDVQKNGTFLETVRMNMWEGQLAI